MVKVLSNATIATHVIVKDANRVAEFIMSAKQPQAMVSIAFRCLLVKALLDSAFEILGPEMLQIIFRKVTKDKNPALGSSPIKPKKFFCSATEVARKSFKLQLPRWQQGKSPLVDGLENYLRFTLGSASLFKKKFMLRVMELMADNIDNDEVVTIILGFVQNGGDQWISRLGAPRRQMSTNASFENVYARTTTVVFDSKKC